MADLDGIRKRIELVDLNLQTAHSKRERESQALMETWEQIRQRFHDQKREMVALRTRVDELEDSRNDMQDLIQNLLTAVEAGLERMADETVPKIKDMASAMLEEDDTHPVPAAGVPTLPVDSSDDVIVAQIEAPPMKSSEDIFERGEFLAAMEESEFVDSEAGFGGAIPPAPRLNEETPDQLLEVSVEPTEAPPMPDEASSYDLLENEPASPGIRSLIERLEETVIRENIAPTAKDDGNEDEEEDELGRDLHEIEALRSELLGLRDRISSGARN